jgi:light-regulated signal transduction histidine kinase (bacteriophytochrome)
MTGAKAAERARKPSEPRVVAALTQRVNQLAEENSELQAFANALAHDLRAPLRTIEGFSKLVLTSQSSALDPQAADYLQRVVAAASRASRLVEDMMSLAWLSRLDMRIEDVDLCVLAHEVARELASRYPERDTVLHVDPSLSARGDGFMLRVVLERLLDNAWKFTRPQSTATIHVGMLTNEERRVYFIRDNGVGFDMADAPKLFRPLQRLHAASEFEGNGLGLAIVRRIVERHGGEVWAQADVDCGATFFFTLGALPSRTAHDGAGGG